MTTAHAHITEATPLEQIVTAPRSVRALALHGFKTLGDVRGRIAEAASVRYCGSAAVAELASAIDGLKTAEVAEARGEAPAARVETPPAKDEAADVEESDHPLVLSSPTRSLRISWLPANKVMQPGGGYAQQEPLWIEFEEGVARLSREAWFLRKYQRDRVRVAEAMNSGTPWRKEAAAFVRGMANFGRDYFLMGD